MAGIDGGGSAEARGEREALGHEIGDDDFARAEMPGPQRAGETDRSRAHDEHRLARAQAGRAEAVQGDGERLDQGALLVVDTGRQAQGSAAPMRMYSA